MVAAEHQLTEKLVFFWHGHWATSVQKVKSAPLMLGQLETFRRARARATSARWSQAMLRDPALILWLDGQRNTRKAPNENLARELMELFTLGIGALHRGRRQGRRPGADRLDGRPGRPARSRFEPDRHDAGAKTILGQTGRFDADCVRRPAGRPSRPHATFLAGRLWFRFAAGEPIPEPPRTGWSRRTARAATSTAMLRALFTDAGVRRDPRPAGQAAGGVGGRRAAPARHATRPR